MGDTLMPGILLVNGIESDNEDLEFDCIGAGKTIKFKRDGVEVASIGDDGFVGGGKVLQMTQEVDQTYISGNNATDVLLKTFSINNVSAGSTIIGQVSISNLMEHIGDKQWQVKNLSGVVLGKVATRSAGNGGWRMPIPTLTFKDSNPTVGTNTYTLSISTTVHFYYNYPTVAYGNPSTHFIMTEVAQ